MIDKHRRFMEVIRKFDPNLKNWSIHEVYEYWYGCEYIDYSYLYTDEFEKRPESSKWANCICSHPNCKYLASIINTKGDILDPVGSNCIKRFKEPHLIDEYKRKVKIYQKDKNDFFKEYDLYDHVEFIINIPYQDFTYNQNNIDWEYNGFGVW